MFTGNRFFALFLRRQIKILSRGTPDLVISLSSVRIRNYVRKFGPAVYTDGAWGGVVVKATSRRVPGSIPGHWGFFSGASDSSMCPGVDSASKMSTRIFLGVKTAGG